MRLVSFHWKLRVHIEVCSVPIDVWMKKTLRIERPSRSNRIVESNSDLSETIYPVYARACAKCVIGSVVQAIDLSFRLTVAFLGEHSKYVHALPLGCIFVPFGTDDVLFVKDVVANVRGREKDVVKLNVWIGCHTKNPISQAVTKQVLLLKHIKFSHHSSEFFCGHGGIIILVRAITSCASFRRPNHRNDYIHCLTFTRLFVEMFLFISASGHDESGFVGVPVNSEERNDLGTILDLFFIFLVVFCFEFRLGFFDREQISFKTTHTWLIFPKGILYVLDESSGVLEFSVVFSQFIAAFRFCFVACGPFSE
mmetsp:Transcript_1088/g.1171  ORF Transcript_1088/g.1171 Transcript_1088/m.1171 type:complete len:310 (+) Transcript_1088:301-1230(+)